MKDGRIKMTGDDLHISTWAIHFTCWPMNRICGGQQGTTVVGLKSTTLHHFIWLPPFYTFSMRHMMCMRIPSKMYRSSFVQGCRPAWFPLCFLSSSVIVSFSSSCTKTLRHHWWLRSWLHPTRCVGNIEIWHHVMPNSAIVLHCIFFWYIPAPISQTR